MINESKIRLFALKEQKRINIEIFWKKIKNYQLI